MLIDLNADVGEGAGNDEAILDLVSSANVACGGHAGDETTMRATCSLAVARGVRIGAHPGYPDAAGFGRRELGLPAEKIRETVEEQLRALAAIAPVGYVKLHGALYHRAGTDPAVAAAVLDAVDAAQVPRIVLCPVGSELDLQATLRGYRTVSEAFADRRYAADGSLVARDAAGSVLAPAQAAAQAVTLALEGGFDSICIHGDAPEAAETARAVAGALRAAGFEPAAFA